MQAKKCDVCGQYYDYGAKGSAELLFRYAPEHIKTSVLPDDVCPDCMVYFENWMSMRKDVAKVEHQA